MTDTISLRGNAGGNGWNYSHPDKDGYLEVIEGTVVEISTHQHTNFQTKEPEYWKNGGPKLDWQLTLRGRSGKELNWRFYAGSSNPEYWNNARTAVVEAIEAAGGDTLNFLLGKFIRVSTEAGEYSLRRQRPWKVEILGEGEHDKVRGVVPFAPPKDRFEAQGEGARAALEALDQQQAAAPPQTNVDVYADDIPF